MKQRNSQRWTNSSAGFMSPAPTSKQVSAKTACSPHRGRRVATTCQQRQVTPLPLGTGTHIQTMSWSRSLRTSQRLKAQGWRNMRSPRFEVYPSEDGWRWRLVAANGRIVATGEAHTRKRDAERAVARLPALAEYASMQPLVDM